jgi:hypothetical protein
MTSKEDPFCNLNQDRNVSPEEFNNKNHCRCSNSKLSQWRGSPHRSEAAYPAVRPPSIGNATPLMNEASSLAR